MVPGPYSVNTEVFGAADCIGKRLISRMLGVKLDTNTERVSSMRLCHECKSSLVTLEVFRLSYSIEAVCPVYETGVNARASRYTAVLLLDIEAVYPVPGL